MSLNRLLLVSAFAASVVCAQKRPFKLDDLGRFYDVRDPQCSPDGQWVAL